MFLKHFQRPNDKELIFNFFISINRDSTERHVRLKIFTSDFLVAGIFLTIPAFVLGTDHLILREGGVIEFLQKNNSPLSI